MIIIGYFHVCQKEGWKKSFDLIFSSIKKSGLYNITTEIRVGIVNDNISVIPNYRFNDSKIKIIFCKPSFEYERPTLYHMRNAAENEKSLYWYCHTKGIKHFGTNLEDNVTDWINLLIYWNITQWRLAINMLNEYDTYGCNKMFDPNYSKNVHYSGNFWWAKSKHIKKLPLKIDSYYCAPEDWICTKNNKMICIFTSKFLSGQHYSLPYDKSNYILPNNFNIYVYQYFNEDLNTLDYPGLIDHYLNFGKNENRNYSMPNNFDFNFYRNAYENNYKLKEKELVKHWFNVGKSKNLIYNTNFNIIGYFHICQKEGWKKSFDIIYKRIKNSGLYDQTSEIRIGIVNDIGYIEEDNRLKDSKFKILFVKSSNEYERATLHHMKESSYIDTENSVYWYCHSKGIKHFKTKNEKKIIDWINFLSYWNFTQWKIAIKMLRFFDIYGCNAVQSRVHYSGNFWWAKSCHIKYLPYNIGEYYTGPEDWVCIKNDRMFNVISMDVNPYKSKYSSTKYKIPNDFNLFSYRKYNKDLRDLSYEELIPHYLKHGKKEGRKYKLENF